MARQEQACRELATRHGWNNIALYVDNDVSASKRRQRPEYARLLDDMRAGRVARVVVWDLDRLTRRPTELEAFIDLAHEHNVDLANVSGEIDLSSAHGRMFARLKGAIARGEVERMGERLQAQIAQSVAQGRPTGRRAYGWNLDGTERPDEADVVREIIRRVGASEPLANIARDLNLRHVPAPGSQAWRTGGLRSIVRRSRNAGLRQHRGKVIGPGPWAALVTPDELALAQLLLSDPKRRTQRGTTPTHLLSGIAECAPCGAVLRAHQGRGRRVYLCRDGFCVSTPADYLDRYVVAALLTRLARSAGNAPERLPTGGATVAALEPPRHEIMSMVADGLLDGTSARPKLVELTEKIQRARVPESRAVTYAALGPLRPATDYAVAWQGMTTGAQRAAVRAMFAKIAVERVGPGHRGSIDARTVIRWRV